MSESDQQQGGARPPARRSVRTVAILAIVFLLVVLVEVASWAFLRFELRRVPRLFRFDYEAHIRGLDAAWLRRHATGKTTPYVASPTLGWRRVKGPPLRVPDGGNMSTDDRGSRVLPGPRRAPLVATYGDSFVECSEVDDAKTWQAHMARELKADVLNFGVGGFGPGQSVLYLEGNLEKGITAPIVILGITAENLNRVMNAYRHFYTYPFVDFPLGFKPMFAARDGAFAQVFAPPKDLQDREAVVRAARAAAAVDGCWALRTERAGFPHVVNAIRFLSARGLAKDPPWPGSAPEAVRRIEYLVERFWQGGRRHGYVPVVALLPHSRDNLRSHAVGAHVLCDFRPDRRHPGLVYVDVGTHIAHGEDGKGLTDEAMEALWQVSHLSAHGNRLVAGALLDALAPHLERARAAAGKRAIMGGEGKR